MTKKQRREDGGPVVSAPLALHWRRWRGIAAAGVAAVFGTFAVAALYRPVGESSRYAVEEQGAVPSARALDPLRAELIRCGALPPQLDDPACRAAWDESRRQFFGESRAIPVPSTPIEPGSPAAPPTQATER